MKIKTSEITGATLNWAVAKCEGHIRPDGGLYAGHQGRVFDPSTNHAHGGPITEREFISTDFDGKAWTASVNDRPICYRAKTLLVAAMRCYVASKLGDEIDVPEQLL